MLAVRATRTGRKPLFVSTQSSPLGKICWRANQPLEGRSRRGQLGNRLLTDKSVSFGRRGRSAIICRRAERVCRGSRDGARLETHRNRVGRVAAGRGRGGRPAGAGSSPSTDRSTGR